MAGVGRLRCYPATAPTTSAGVNGYTSGSPSPRARSNLLLQLTCPGEPESLWTQSGVGSLDGTVRKTVPLYHSPSFHSRVSK